MLVSRFLPNSPTSIIFVRCYIVLYNLIYFQKDANNKFDIEMKMNFKDPKWPYLHFHVADSDEFGFTVFEGNIIAESFFE